MGQVNSVAAPAAAVVVIVTGVKRRRRRRREADWSIVLCWLIWLPCTCCHRGRENQRATGRAARAPIRYMAAAWSIACWKVGNWLPFYPGESGAVTEMCLLATDFQLYFITQLVHLRDLFVCLRSPFQSYFSLYLSKMSTTCWSRARAALRFLSCFPSPFLPSFGHNWVFLSTLAEVLMGEGGNKDNLFLWAF